MLNNNQPIGIFDSGIGGLSIANKIHETLASENLIYFADSQHAPYGEKTDNFITSRSIEISDFLVERGAKAIVVACNTATTTAIQSLRARYNVPIIGIEPGIKPAVVNSKSGVVGILATSRTFASNSFDLLVKRLAGCVKVEIQPCPDLVLQVEALQLDSAKTISLVRKYISPLIDKGADHIVLGCTHYNYLENLVAKVAGQSVNVINTTHAVVNQVARQLNVHQLLHSDNVTGIAEFWTSGDLVSFQKQIATLWKKPLNSKALSINSHMLVQQCQTNI